MVHRTKLSKNSVVSLLNMNQHPMVPPSSVKLLPMQEWSAFGNYLMVMSGDGRLNSFFTLQTKINGIK